MLRLSFKIFNSLKVIILAGIFTLAVSLNIDTYGRLYNQQKIKDLNLYLNNESSSLVLLTVTGDQRYKNKNLEKMYKELQIIHILIISASNILLYLNFIQLFIYRISKTNFVLTIIFIYIYGKFISMPDTFIRALQTIFISNLFIFYGLKSSKKRYGAFLITLYFISSLMLNNSLSYKLSAIYSSVIMIVNFLTPKITKSKLISFLVLSTILSLTSSLLFNLDNLSSICTSFIANIFISLFYDIAIYLAYITYLLPNIVLINYLKSSIYFSFEKIFVAINLVKHLTYNICYESIL